MLPVSINAALRSVQPNIKVKFFSEESLLSVFDFAKSRELKVPKKASHHKIYGLLLKVLLRTGARMEEIVQYDRSAKAD